MISECEPQDADDDLWKVFTVDPEGMSSKRNVFVTEKGVLGLGPGELQIGDLVVIMLGARMPFVLREEGDGQWKLIGECYCHGFMNGELLEKISEEGRETETFALVWRVLRSCIGGLESLGLSCVSGFERSSILLSCGYCKTYNEASTVGLEA
jgi:hypothetical protein